MSDDHYIRMALIAAFVVTIPVLVYHRVKAHTGEKLDRLQEGLVILVGLRLGGVACMGALIVWMVNPQWMRWASVGGVPMWLRWCGVGIGFVTAVLLLWTLRNLGRNLTDTVVTREKAVFVCSGPYRWVRHPFYGCVALMIVANSLATANWMIFVGGGLLLVMMVVRTRKEEEKLVERFGEEYRRYMATTPRFVPRPRK